ncbi:OmpA family protein [Flavobacterium sp. N2038]|uniref:OmpA family protein n=1 Tax=Flavobacterium sp. N2038 TaxID=2986829 RepID=UPI00222535A1|nr:OmpA family protein [Flavobacterium sp. N2038]
MEKGIERIKWTGEGQVAANHSIPNVKITIKADQFVYFQVSEWADDTTKEEKEKNIYWNLLTNKPRKSLLESTRKANQKYGIKLPKKLCGPYAYYLEASISGLKYSQKAGLVVGGWCESKIIKSKWSTSIDGPDVRNSKVFSYGETIYLNVETEGLNGHKNLIVDIYRNNAEGELINVYTSVDVNDGEINIAITDTFTWFGKIKGIKDVEQFYIKVKNPITKKYIPNSNNETIHARFLKIKKKIEPSFPKPPTNVTAFKVGEQEKYMKNAGHCNFKKIILYEDNEPVSIFDEGKFSQQVSGKDRFITVKKIHYDFDKFNIRPDAKKTIDEITKFLLASPYLPVEIGSHTDCRGTDEYNDKLSHKRAQTIVDSLVKSGIDAGRISAKGYGKSRLLHLGENIPDTLHEQNRRTTLLFKVYGNNANPINIDIIAPSYSYNPRKKVKLKIPDQQFKACFKEGKNKHSLDKNVIENTQYSLNKTTPYNGDTIEHPVFSIINADFKNHYVKYLRKFLFPKETINYGDITNDYYFYINSCAYYSDKTKPTIHIKTYPDVVWMGHFQFNYQDKSPFYFHQKELSLKRGIKQEIKELTESVFGSLMVLIPGGWVTRDVLFPYVEKQAEFYDVGLHAIYDRTLEKKEEALSLKGTEVDFIKEDNTTRYIAAFVVYELVAIGIIIDLLMIYLTRGKNLEGRLAKIASKVKKVSKYLNDSGAELVPPSIAINTGMYYKTQLDNRLALIFEANIKADPLVAINFEKKFDLKDLIKQKLTHKDNQKKQGEINAFLKTIKTNLTATLSIVGEIAINHRIQYNLLTNTHTVTDKIANLVQTQTVTYSEKIKGKMFLEGDVSKKFFKFYPIQVDANIKLDLNCEAVVKTEYGYDQKGGKGLFMEKKLIFSGLKGAFTGNVKVRAQDEELLDYSPNEGKPIPFTLFDGDTYNLGRIYFFNTATQK